MFNRSLGWIQDASDFSSLKKTVDVLNPNSSLKQELINNTIPKYVPERYGREKLIHALENNENGILFSLLIGGSSSNQLTIEERITLFDETEEQAEKIVVANSRTNAACSGILQAAISGQKRPYQTDWSVSAFIRWSIALGFVSYCNETDICKITSLGLEFSNAHFEEEQKEILSKAFLNYSPVIRVLSLLNNNLEPLTKFEIGSQLGFIGEDGFSSISQRLFIHEYYQMPIAERKKFKSDVEGSSDKYARMICGWLNKLGWVEKNAKVCYGYGDEQLEMSAYSITLRGRTMLRNGLKSSCEKIVHFEMLATKAKDKNYLRKRRAIILKFISTKAHSLEEIRKHLQRNRIPENIPTIIDDLEGFNSIGITINKINNKYISNNEIKGLEIPQERVSRTNILEIKERVIEKLEHLNHKFLLLIDYSFDGTKNRDFELLTAELFTEELDFGGCHLGGSNKPDNIIYYNNKGVIIDNKAYGSGYHLPMNQRDEMFRYVTENKERNVGINPTEWWKNFPSNISLFNFLFISSGFTGRFEDGLNNISMRSGISGAAISSENLLYFAEFLKSERITYYSFFDSFQNKEIIFN